MLVSGFLFVNLYRREGANVSAELVRGELRWLLVGNRVMS
jgi:hypothetical protein